MSELDKKALPLEPYGCLDVEMLRRFSEANGICGHEKGASRVMAEYLKDAADTIDYDNLGSIIGCKKGKDGGPSVAIFGHLDEVGFLVKKIEDSGFIRLINVGGMWPHLLLAQEVTITTRDGREYVGVISSPPPHGMPAEERAKVKELEDLFIDLGVNDADEVRALGIRVGDTITPPHPVPGDEQPQLPHGQGLGRPDRCGHCHGGVAQPSGCGH